jgi:hypothetical protein
MDRVLLLLAKREIQYNKHFKMTFVVIINKISILIIKKEIKINLKKSKKLIKKRKS